jgi:hypothetical protein
MRFHFKKSYAGNEKPIMQRVQGDTLTEWRVDEDKDAIVREQIPLAVPAHSVGVGTFFLGGMLTTRDELADYLLEANERNAEKEKTKVDRLPQIQKKIERTREMHAAAITSAVEWKKKGYKLPKHTRLQRRQLLLPKAVAVERPDGRLEIIGETRGR